MHVELRNFVADDAAAVNRVALAAFEQYRDRYQDWEGFSRLIGNLAALAAGAEVIVAIAGEEVAGAVAYVGPGRPKAAFFRPEWPIIRMLVVDPRFRGNGIGRLLTEACVERAVRDGAGVVALHTSPIMEVALAMYSRMGFCRAGDAPDIHGVAYGVYLKSLSRCAQ